MANRNLNKNSIGEGIIRLAIVLAAVLIAFSSALFIPEKGDRAEAVSISINGDKNGMIKNADREAAYVILIEHMNSLKRKDLSAAQKAKLDEIMYDANVFIANTEMTVDQLEAYVTTVMTRMNEVADNVPKAEQFLFIDNRSEITSAKYGEATSLTLSVVNLGDTTVSDVVITPTVDTDLTKWPFVIQTASDARIIENLRPASSIEESYGLAGQAVWNFVVADGAKTGVYPLKFHVMYYRNGAMEESDLTTYINIKGKSSSGKLIEDEKDKKDDDKISTPRIIVTGFSTDPEEIYAGDTFNVTITVQNTSTYTAVKNIQFDLTAANTGDDLKTTYEAFLPTSGSATMYLDSIGAGETAELSLELAARGDLTERPYAVSLEMNYEDAYKNPFKSESNFSIPVHQAARVDTGTAEISPESAMVGDIVNVCFPIYNKGQTTLYNVQVDFPSESFEGGSCYVGKLETGATGDVDASLTAIAPSTDDGTVIAIISYEDASGNVSTLEKELNIYVEDYVEMEFNEIDEDGDGIMEGIDYDGDGIVDEYYEGMEKSSFPVWIIVVIAVVILLVVIVVIIIIIVVVAKKKKKKAMELAAASDDDDED